MAKYEKEVKILDVKVNEMKEKLEDLGAEFVGTKNQKIYTYDIPTIYYRYLECIELLKSNRNILKKTAIRKLEVLFDELIDLVKDEELEKIYAELKVENLYELLKKNNLVEILENSIKFNEVISNKTINPNKWLRLRKSNDKIELTLKQVYEKNSDKIQKVKEIEVTTSNLEETNLLLENLGIVRRNYQEKIRHSYKYGEAEIEIDEWPYLNPYIEIESSNEKLIDEIISKLELSNHEIVSINTEQLYKRQGIDVLDILDLCFKN